MRDDELPGLLLRAAEEVPEGDFAERSWARGRTQRRRRVRAGALGGLVAAGLVALAVAQAPGEGGLLHPSGTRPAAGEPGMLLEPPQGTPVDPEPEGRGSAEPDMPALVRGVPAEDAQGTRERSHQVWVILWTACLESRGYTVDAVGQALTMTRDGAGPGDYLRDRGLCRAELRTDSPVVLPRSGEVSRADRTALLERWFEYDRAHRCLVQHDLPTDPRPMLAEAFADGLVQAQLPPWHPYLPAARQGHYEQARDRCPLGGP